MKPIYLSSNLKKLRNNFNYSYEQLEALSNVPKNTIYRIESNKTINPGILSIIKLAEVFHITIDEFIYSDIAIKGDLYDT